MNMSPLTVKASQLNGTICAPSSKSHTMRALLFASLADGESRINNYLDATDTHAMITACQNLGAKITLSPQTLRVIGVAGKPNWSKTQINAGNSGQVLRFIGAIAGLSDQNIILSGDQSICRQRIIAPLIDGLRQLGANCEYLAQENHPPISVKGPIHNNTITVDGTDSQPISGLLMASAFLLGKTIINVTNPAEQPWIELTLDWFDRLGINYKHQYYKQYTVNGKAHYPGFNYNVPGDFSSVAYPIVAALITQSSIRINNLNQSDSQGDKILIELLKAMGANIYFDNDSLMIKPSGQLQAIDIDINHCIDALPILAVLGCYCKGQTRLTNAAGARHKESDRLATISQELKKMGAKITETASSLIIEGSQLNAATLHSYDDHRIAMSLAVAALAIEQPSTIAQTQCIAKSYPQFMADMQQLGGKLECVA